MEFAPRREVSLANSSPAPLAVLHGPVGLRTDVRDGRRNRPRTAQLHGWNQPAGVNVNIADIPLPTAEERAAMQNPVLMRVMNGASLVQREILKPRHGVARMPPSCTKCLPFALGRSTRR